MLWVDGKRVVISRKVLQESLKIPKALMEKLTKWIDLKFFFSWDNDANNNDDSNKGMKIWICVKNIEVKYNNKRLHYRQLTSELRERRPGYLLRLCLL